MCLDGLIPQWPYWPGHFLPPPSPHPFQINLQPFPSGRENCTALFEFLKTRLWNVRSILNKNNYVVRNAVCARSRYTLKLSLIFNGRYAVLETLDWLIHWLIHWLIDSLKKILQQMVFDIWYLINGIWYMVFDKWYLINGIW